MSNAFDVRIQPPMEVPVPSARLLARIGGLPSARAGLSFPSIPLQGLRGDWLESWVSPEDVHEAQHEPLRYRCGLGVMAGCLQVPAQADLAQVTEGGYRRLLAFLAEQNEARHLLRVWHYFPDLHAAAPEGNRYQAFCVGRHRAILQAEGLDPARMPAATVIGSRQGGLTIYFLAGAEPGVQVENPRQVSAYRYPAEHGPVSPSFSRATLKDWGDTLHLYVSGTASIVGHESMHAGDVLRQLDETLVNLHALLGEAQRIDARAPCRLEHAAYLRIYLRHVSDLGIVSERLASVLPAGIPLQYLEGDVCRPELLVELESMLVRRKDGASRNA